MKTTEYPEEDARTAPFAAAEKETRATEAKARALDLPGPSAEAGATRNIALGVVCLIVAAVALWLGMYFNRTAAVVAVIVSLGSFGLLWLFANSRVLRQKHGVFFALALVVCFGALVPFVVGGLQKLDSLARSQLGEQPEALVTSKGLPVPTRDTAPLPPTVPDEEPPAVAEKATPKPKPVDDGIVREFIAPALDPGEGKIVQITEDCIVAIDGRKWKVLKGQQFKYSRVEDGIVTFSASGQDVSIAVDSVKFIGKSIETPEKITQMAQFEAMSRYPALAEKDSPENNIFVVTVKEMRADPAMEEVLFKDPKWPLVIAEQLAVKHGWKRGDIPNTEEATPVATPADGAAKPAEAAPVDELPEPKQIAPPAPAIPPVPALPPAR